MDISETVIAIGELLHQRQQSVTTIESCTGGGIAQALTSVAGSSNWFHRGFVTYSNQAKTEMVGVPAETIGSFGAVSEEVAQLMALGGQNTAGADYAVAVTGIAGPDGGSAAKPVGMVCFGWASPSGLGETTTRVFDGDRTGIRDAAVAFALDGLLARLRED